MNNGMTIMEEVNSQILRRPQDDSKKGRESSLGCCCSSPGLPPIIVILRPPKDLAVLSFDEAIANIG
jgi:hypothetical protein